MSGTLSRFRIEALHNIRTIDVPIEDDRLVLVGENGTGKSTVANLIYFFLTHQWHRMLTYQFEAITATIGSEKITISRSELANVRDTNRFLLKLPPSIRSRFEELLLIHSLEDLVKGDYVAQIARQTGFSRAIMMDYLFTLHEEGNPLSSHLEKIAETIDSLIGDQVLYLPTYRRIEQDLASIFRGSLSADLKNALERWTRRGEGASYIEFVEFGMQDVEKTIQKKMSELKDSLRDDLNNLTGTYLHDVIQGAYRSAEPSKISELDEVTLDAIFSRIDKRILPEQQQKRLRDIVAKIKRERSIPEGDKVVVHFLTRLIELYKAQQENERDVLEFVRVCNIYLTGKELVYDNLKFDISIYQQNVKLKRNEQNNSQKIAMQMLSSGEKQIVSLFSHIYLSGRSGYYVIIDEPELSLSVPWQKRFLPDILETGRCNGLIAVTHSPFIFENQLERYTHSLDEFMEPLDDIS